MAVAAGHRGSAGHGDRQGYPVRRQAMLAVYAGIVLLGVLFGMPAAAVDVLLICCCCLTAGLALVVLLARKTEELSSFPVLLIGATCLHLATTVAAARRVIFGSGQVGMIMGAIGGRLTELSGAISAGLFLAIVIISLFVIVSALRHLRTKAALNIAVLAGNPVKLGGDTAARLLFNTGMGWAGRYMVLEAVTSALLLCIAVGGAGVIGTIEEVNYVAPAVGAGLAMLVPAAALAVAGAWLMGRGFVVCHAVAPEPQTSPVQQKQPVEAKTAPAPAAKEAVFDEPNSVRAQREYQRIAQMLLEGAAKDAKIVLMAAKSSTEMGVTIPVNVAAAIAGRKRRCLVVDMDIARDAVAKAFGTAHSDGPVKTCIRGLYVWSARSFCENTIPEARKLEAAQKHFDKTIIYWPGAGQGHEEIVTSVGAAMFFGGKGVEMAVLEARLTRNRCVMLA